MEKTGQLVVGSSPCEACGARPSDIVDPKGQLLCAPCARQQLPVETHTTKTVKMASEHTIGVSR